MKDEHAPVSARSRIPWIIVAIAAPCLVATLVFSGINGSFREDAALIGVFVVMMLGYCGVGALVASRAPGNPVGWLMMAFGISFLITALADEYGQFAVERGAAPLEALAYWLNAWIFLGAIVSLPLMLLYFPDGELLSPRWRWAVRVELVTGTVVTLLSMFAPGPIDLDVTAPPDNPLGVESLSGIGEAAWQLLVLLFFVGILAAVSIVLRYRRSEGTDRQRMRLFTSVVALALMLAIAAAVSGDGSAIKELFFLAFFFAIGIGIPAAMAIAILRYRMYDVELVIRKTVRFVVVATLIVIVLGAGALVASGPIVGRLVDPDRPASILVFGVAIGLLVRPLWRVSRRLADRVVFGGRSTPYEVLTEFSERVGESYATDDVLPRMAAVLGNAVGADHADVWLEVGDQQRHAAGWPDDAGPERPGVDTAPITYQGDDLGALSVVMPAADPMNDAKRRLMTDLAAQAGPVLRNVRLLEDLRGSRRRIVSAQDERARKLERDIHDGVQQQLVALAVKLRLADQLIDRDPAKAHEALAGLQGDATAALEDLRDLARGIYPPLLADQGLEAALTAQARKAAVPTIVHAAELGRFTSEAEAAVYFCTLEALNNAAKYAQASAVEVSLERVDGHLKFSISDDGRGFDPGLTSYGTGLQGMADRLEAVGGSLDIATAPGEGVRVAGRLPVARRQG